MEGQLRTLNTGRWGLFLWPVTIFSPHTLGCDPRWTSPRTGPRLSITGQDCKCVRFFSIWSELQPTVIPSEWQFTRCWRGLIFTLQSGPGWWFICKLIQSFLSLLALTLPRPNYSSHNDKYNSGQILPPECDGNVGAEKTGVTLIICLSVVSLGVECWLTVRLVHARL